MSETKGRDCPGGPGAKNPSADAGHMDLISGSGRSHTPWSSERTHLEAMLLSRRRHHREQPVHSDQRAALLSATRGSPRAGMKAWRQPTGRDEGPEPAHGQG